MAFQASTKFKITLFSVLMAKGASGGKYSCTTVQPLSHKVHAQTAFPSIRYVPDVAGAGTRRAAITLTPGTWNSSSAVNRLSKTADC